MTQKIKRLASLSAISLTIVIVVGCGEQSSSSTSRDTSSASALPIVRKAFGDYDNDDYGPGDDADNDDSDTHKDRDNDSDNSSESYYDSDDNSVFGFGQPATTAEKRAVTALVKRYYAAAAAADGTTACELLSVPLARSVAEDLGRAPGPPYLRGDRCSIVMSKVFTLNHRQLSAYAVKLRVRAVRVKHAGGLAILDFTTLPGRVLSLQREHRTWKVGALVDSELP
jgi:hypothetical protein